MEKVSEYSESLKDPRWQKKRLEILNRDNWTCQICGAKDKMLHVHHTCYVKGKKPWEYEDRLLITLCKTCHADDKKNKDQINSYLDELRSNGVTNYELSQIMESIVIHVCGMHDDNYIPYLTGCFVDNDDDDYKDDEYCDPYNWPSPCLLRLAEMRLKQKKG